MSQLIAEILFTFGITEECRGKEGIGGRQLPKGQIAGFSNSNRAFWNLIGFMSLCKQS